MLASDHRSVDYSGAEAYLSFLHWQDIYEYEKPFQVFIDIPKDAEDQRDTNLVFERVRLTINDVRGILADLSLDANGFMYRRHSMKITNFPSRKSVEQNYLPEIEELLKCEVEGADRIFFFDWRVSEGPGSPHFDGALTSSSFGKMRQKSRTRSLT